MHYIFNNFINTLRKYKVSSLLNVAGMAVAFAAFYVIMTQVTFDFGYNKSLKDADRTYVITLPSQVNDGKYSAWLSRPLGEKLVSSSPLVESGGVFEFWYNDTDVPCYVSKNGTASKIGITNYTYSAGGIRALGFEAVEGSLDALSKLGTIAVAKSVADKYGLSVGDRISWTDPAGEKDAQEIVAIYKDFPDNSDLGHLGSIQDMGDASITNAEEWSYSYVVKLRSADDAEEYCSAVDGIVADYIREIYDYDNLDSEMQNEVNEAAAEFKVHIVPLDKLYFCGDMEGAPGRTGNSTTDITLLAVAILTILIALINFINFFFALVPARLRSVNTYKIFGVSRGSLVLNFVFEAVGLVAIALIIAVVLVIAFTRTSAADLLSSTTAFGDNIPVLLLTILVAVVTAIAGSVYPAFYITSFQPALVLKGSFSGSKAGRSLRNALIGFQFVISIAMIICACFIRMQHSYMMNYDMGFNKSQLLTGKIPYGLCWYGSQNAAFESKLRSNPDIADITWADGRMVNASRMGWGRNYKDGSISFQCYPVAYNFLSFMGIPVVEGRDFTSSDELSDRGVMIFNETAQKEYDIDLETPGPGHSGDNAVVAGICKDFLFKPLQYGVAPFAFYIFGKDHSWRSGLNQIFVRTTEGADIGEVIKFIRNTVAEMAPDAEPETYWIDFFDKELGRQYARESSLSVLIGLFTLIAIIISLMGVFGLVLFDTQHRSREIAIRRVMGGSIADILRMFNVKYVWIVLLSFILAAPVSWLIMNTFLASYAYRTPLHWWVFAGALLAVLAVTILLVTLRSHSAATANPVDKLKDE